MLIPIALSSLDTVLITVSLLTGLATAVIALGKIGGEKAATVVGYQGEILDDLNEERERLRRAIQELQESKDRYRRKYEEMLSENHRLVEMCEDLKKRVERIENGGKT